MQIKIRIICLLICWIWPYIPSLALDDTSARKTLLICISDLGAADSPYSAFKNFMQKNGIRVEILLSDKIIDNPEVLKNQIALLCGSNSSSSDNDVWLAGEGLGANIALDAESKLEHVRGAIVSCPWKYRSLNHLVGDRIDGSDFFKELQELGYSDLDAKAIKDQALARGWKKFPKLLLDYKSVAMQRKSVLVIGPVNQDIQELYNSLETPDRKLDLIPVIKRRSKILDNKQIDEAELKGILQFIKRRQN